MNTVIICEGESDAIVLSYYLEHQNGWHFSKTGPIGLTKITKNTTEKMNWYHKGNNDYLLIWAVGGNEFEGVLQKVLELNKINANSVFENIIFITDNDTDAEVENRINTLNNLILKFVEPKKMEKNIWLNDVKQNVSFDEVLSLKFLFMTLPEDGSGALETYLLDAIAENDKFDKYIVDQSRSFIDNLCANNDQYGNKYLDTRRSGTKAKLSTFFSVVSPERTFVKINTLIESITWEKYRVIQKNCKLLDSI